MLKHVYELDSNGYINKVHAANVNETGEIADENRKSCIVIHPPNGMFKAKWTGSEWVEGKTQAEFDEDAFTESLNPSTEEITEAEFEIKILNTLMEVDLI